MLVAYLLKDLSVPLQELFCVFIMRCSVANQVCHVLGTLQYLLLWHCRQAMCPVDFIQSSDSMPSLPILRGPHKHIRTQAKSRPCFHAS